MLRPTYFLGIGKSGREIIDYMKIYSFITTKSHDLFGLFRYGYVDLKFGPAGGASGLFEQIFSEDKYSMQLQGAVSDGREVLFNKNTNEKENPIDRFWNSNGTNIEINIKELKSNIENSMKRGEIAEKLKFALNIEHTPAISSETDIVIIGESDEAGVSLFLNGLAKKFSKELSIKPYGLIYIDTNSQNSFDTLYEIFTSYFPPSIPFFNTVYLYKDDFDNKNVTYYTAARFLLLTQLIVDVPGKLVDVDSDYGRGNVVLWKLGGAINRQRESKFFSLLNNIKNFIIKTKAPEKVKTAINDEEEMRKVEQILTEKILKSAETEIKVQNAWNKDNATIFDNYMKKIWKKAIKENMWSSDIKGLHFIKYIHKNWEKYFDEKAPLLWGDNPLNSANEFPDGRWEKAYLKAAGSFKEYVISNERWQKTFNIVELNEKIDNFVEETKKIIEKYSGLIEKALRYWCTDGKLKVSDEVVSDEEILKFLNEFEREQNVFVFEELRDVLNKMLSSFYSPLQNVKEEFDDGCISNALENIGDKGTFKKFADSRSKKKLYEGWVGEAPRKRSEGVIKLETVSKELNKNLFMGDYYYLRVYTGFGLQDFSWDSVKGPGNPVYVDSNGERELLFMKFIAFILLSFDFDYKYDNKNLLITAVREKHFSKWESKGNQLYLKLDTSNFEFNTQIISLRELVENVRNKINSSLRPVVLNLSIDDDDKKHLESIFTNPYTGEMSELGVSLINDVLKLHSAPRSVKALIENFQKIINL